MDISRAGLMAAAVVIGSWQTASAGPAPVYKSAGPASIYNWTGFHFGANLGYGWGSPSAGIASNSPLFAALITTGSIPSSLDAKPKGGLFGFQFGYNYQQAKAVYGLEADISYANIRGGDAVTLPGPLLPFATYRTSVDQRLKWFGTLRGRAGITATDNLLVYATGGLAFGEIEYSGNIRRSAFLLNYNVPGSATVTKAGWTIGAGAEYALRNKWSVKAEYLYYDLGKTDATGNLTTLAGVVTASQATYSFATRGSIVRIGLNYKFN